MCQRVYLYVEKIIGASLMSLTQVGVLYNDLCRLEKHLKRGKSYPVHKSLNARALGYEDVYAWLIGEQHILPQGALLDAGCGVGYGSQLIALQTQNTVTGVSLSTVEIDLARHSTQASAATQRLTFQVKSFDDVPRDVYDQIVAVESLKHSVNIRSTLNRWKARLRAGGRLVIVDDIFSGQQCSQKARELRSRWYLSELLSRDHILAEFRDFEILEFDLTFAMRLPGITTIKGKTVLSWAASKLRSEHKGIQAFAGGCALDHLYHNGEMRYLALILKSS